MLTSILANLLVGGIVVALIGLALCYIIRARKRGVKCIGCPEGSKCASCCCKGSAACRPAEKSGGDSAK